MPRRCSVSMTLMNGLYLYDAIKKEKQKKNKKKKKHQKSSGLMTLIQRRINFDATSGLIYNVASTLMQRHDVNPTSFALMSIVNATLYKRHVSAGS